MLIFVYGEQGPMMKRHVQAMKDRFIDKYDPSQMNVAEFTFPSKEYDMDIAMQSVRTAPFLAEKRMVVIRGVLSTATRKDLYEPWIEALKTIPESTIVILQDELDEAKAKKHAISKAHVGNDDVHVYAFGSMTEADIAAWVVKEVANAGGRIHASVARSLVTQLGMDIWLLQNEIQKLVAFVGAEEISEQHIATLSHGIDQDQIFAFIDTVFSGRTSEAVRMLRQQRGSGSADMQLLAMFVRQIRQLLRYMSYAAHHHVTTGAAKALNISPYIIRKIESQANRFTYAQVKHLHDIAFLYDMEIKNGSIRPETALERLVLFISDPQTLDKVA